MGVNKLILAISIVAASALTCAQASDDGIESMPRYSKQYDKCMDASEGVTSYMIECMNQEYKYQNSRLNLNYKKLMSGLESEHAKKLKEAQRAWIKYRDASVELASFDEGTMSVLNGNAVMLDMTTDRANDLERMVMLYIDDGSDIGF